MFSSSLTSFQASYGMSQQGNKAHPFGGNFHRTTSTSNKEARTLDRVTEIFGDKFEADVIRLILEDCNWKEEEAIEKLCQLASDDTASSQSQPIGLDIIACSFLDSADEDGTAQDADQSLQEDSEEPQNAAGDVTLQTANSETSKSQSKAHSEGVTAASEVRSDGICGLTYDYSKLFASDDLPPFTSGANTVIPGVQLYSRDFALSTEPLKAKVGQPRDNDHCRDKHADISVSRNAEAATSASTDTDKVSQGFQKPLAPPKASKHGVHVDTSQKPRSKTGLVASSSDFPGSSCTDSKPLATRSLEPEVVPVTSVPASPSRQQTSDSPVSAAHSTSSSNVSSNPPVIDSSKLQTANISAGQSSSSMALSAGAPEFVPMLTPTTTSMLYPSSQPRFFTPMFPPQPLQPPFFPVEEDASYTQSPEQMESPMARMFGMPSWPSPRNVALNRFVGPNIYLPPHRFPQPMKKNQASASSLQYAAAAKSPVHRASTEPNLSTQNPQGSKPEEKSPPVERIERHIHDGSKLLVLMRGLPGSGKSYLARQIQGDGQVFSTDDFFMNGNIYEYNQDKLSEAHEWNQKRVQKALDEGVTPVIVDNTNVMMWEMLNYAEMAYTRGYIIEVLQPDNPWSFQPKRLAKYNSHNVPIESIKRMKDRYETVNTGTLMAHLKSKAQKKPSGTGTSANQPRKKDAPSSTASHVKQPPPKAKATSAQNSQKTSVPLQSNTTGKRANKNSQKEFLSVRDTCAKLLKDGAKDEEIEAMIFMANLTDSERLEIKDYLDRTRNNMREQTNRKQSKSKGNRNKGFTKESAKSFKDFNPFSVLETSDLPEADQNSSQPVIHNDKGSFTAKENVAINASPDSLSWENPKPQPQRLARSKVTPAGCVPMQDVPDNISLTQEPDAGLKTMKVPEVETTWEKPMPQRRERTPRSARKSESEKVKTEDNNIMVERKTSTEETEEADTLHSSSGMEVELANQNKTATGGPVEEQVEGESSEENIACEERVMVDKSDDIQTAAEREGEEDSSASVSAESQSDSDSEADKTDHSDVIIEEETENTFCSEEKQKEENSEQSIDNKETETDLTQTEGTTSEKTSTAEDGASEKESGSAVSLSASATATEKETINYIDVPETSESAVLIANDEAIFEHSSSAQKTEQVCSLNDTKEEAAASDNTSSLVAYSSSEEEDDGKGEPPTYQASSDAASLLTVTSPEKQSVYGASGENSESSCPASPRRKVRRKKNKAPAVPFFDDSTKQKLSTDWKTFKPENQIQDACPDISEDEETAETSPDAGSRASTSTQTEGRDFGAAAKGTESPTDGGYKFLAAHEHYVPADVAGVPIPSVKTLGQKRTLDKSTTVDITDQPSVEWLYDCFPGLAVAHLNEVLEVCNGDVDMAVELMFEWGISTPITPQDKRQLSREIARQRSQSVISSPRSPGIASTDSAEDTLPSPPTLVDLCMRQIPDNSLALQQQLINSSEQRLQRIEKMETARVRSISLDEVTTGFGLPDGISLAAFTASNTAQKGGAYTLKSVSESVSSAESSKASSERGSVTDLQSVITVDRKGEQQHQALQSKKTASSGTGKLSVSPHARGSESTVKYPADYSVHGSLALQVPASLVTSLEQLFGALPIANRDSASPLTVHLDHGTAQRLHQCLAQSLSFQVQEQADMSEEEKSRQLREDEALAQFLQEEEEIDCTLAAISAAPSRTAKGSSARQRHRPLSDIDIRFQGYPVPPPPLPSFRPHAQPVNFQDIMKEEMAKQQSHEQQVKMLEATGDHIAIATKLKREKLFQHFPGVDERFLEEIFQANGYILETTVQVIEAALGSKQPVSHRLEMSPARDSADFEVDIELAKQESLKELQNSVERSEEEFQRWDAWDTDDADYQELRQEALLHYRMRRECFSKAHEAHRRGMKEVATFYSQQAHRHFSRMKEANTRASEKMLEIRQTRVDQEMTLDLHGFHVEEAITILKRVIEEKEKDLQVNPSVNRQYLNVVTGQGKHSQHGVAKIKPAVKSYLESVDYRFQEKAGVLKVFLRPFA